MSTCFYASKSVEISGFDCNSQYYDTTAWYPNERASTELIQLSFLLHSPRNASEMSKFHFLMNRARCQRCHPSVRSASSVSEIFFAKKCLPGIIPLQVLSAILRTRCRFLDLKMRIVERVARALLLRIARKVTAGKKGLAQSELREI